MTCQKRWKTKDCSGYLEEARRGLNGYVWQNRSAGFRLCSGRWEDALSIFHFLSFKDGHSQRAGLPHGHQAVLHRGEQQRPSVQLQHHAHRRAKEEAGPTAAHDDVTECPVWPRWSPSRGPMWRFPGNRSELSLADYLPVTGGIMGRWHGRFTAPRLGFKSHACFGLRIAGCPFDVWVYPENPGFISSSRYVHLVCVCARAHAHRRFCFRNLYILHLDFPTMWLKNLIPTLWELFWSPQGSPTFYFKIWVQIKKLKVPKRFVVCLVT